MFSLVTILDRWVDPEETTKCTQGAQKKAITVAAWLTGPHIEWSAGSTHKHFVCKMLCHANLPTGYSSCCVFGDIMSNAFYDVYCHTLNHGTHLTTILLYEFKHITKKGGMCVTMISFSQLSFMGSKVQWNTTIRDKEDGYKRCSFHQRSLLPSIFSTILCFIRNHQVNW